MLARPEVPHPGGVGSLGEERDLEVRAVASRSDQRIAPQHARDLRPCPHEHRHLEPHALCERRTDLTLQPSGGPARDREHGVAALQVGRDVAAAEVAQQRLELRHRDALVAPDVDPAEQCHMCAVAQLTIASASISTSIAGSTSAATWTIVVAGRTLPKTSACALPMDSQSLAMSVT